MRRICVLKSYAERYPLGRRWRDGEKLCERLMRRLDAIRNRGLPFIDSEFGARRPAAAVRMAMKGRDMKKSRNQRFVHGILALVLGAEALSWTWAADQRTTYREIEDKRFEVIDIPLSPWPRSNRGWEKYFPSFYGFWLNDTQLVMSVLHDGPEAYAQKRSRIVLIDTDTGNYRVLVDQGYEGCRSKKHKVMAYLPYNPRFYSEQWPIPGTGGTPDERKKWLEDRQAKIAAEFRYVRLDDDGTVSPLEGSSPIERNCAPAGFPVDAAYQARGNSLREDDGFIDVRSPDNRETNTHGTAKLVRPGQPPIDLGFPTGAVSWPTYLPYYDKYLMSSLDYAGHGSTSKKYGGVFWKYPYDVSPYWLVSRTGEVEGVPYPKIIRDYGIAGFQYIWPTPRGMLINQTWPASRGFGLLLLQGEKLLRIWGGPPSLNIFQDNRGREEIAYVLNMSPDACRIVFTHAKGKDYPGEGAKHFAPIPLSVLNICKDR